MREATKILNYLGVLESRRAEGTFVSSGFPESMIDPMVYGIILNKGEDFESLMELRELTKVGILRLAISEQQPKGLELIRDKLSAFEEAVAGETVATMVQTGRGRELLAAHRKIYELLSTRSMGDWTRLSTTPTSWM